MSKKEYDDLLVLCEIEKNNAEFIHKAVKKVAYSGNPLFIYNLIGRCPAVDTPENMKILEDAIIALTRFNHNILIAYEFMYETATDLQIKNFDLNRFEELIISFGNPKYMDYCIRCIKGTNVPRMLKALYNTKNEKYITRVKEKYEHSVNKEIYPSEDIFNSEYDNALEDSKNDLYVPNWMSIIQNSNYKLLCEIVISTRLPYYINELADYFEYLIEYGFKDDLNKFFILSNLIGQLNRAIEVYGSVLDKYEYLWSVKRANKESLMEDIVLSGEVKFIYYSLDIPGVNKSRLCKAINQSGDEKYIKLIEPDTNEQTLNLKPSEE